MSGNRRLRVGVIFGGKSAEHEVSLVSARAIMAALDRQRYEVIPIGITKQGLWLAGGDPWRALSAEQRLLPQLQGTAAPAEPSVPVTLVGGAAGLGQKGEGTLVPLGGQAKDLNAPATAQAAGRASPPTDGPAGSIGSLDVVFPVLHGPYGEDGSIQGLLELAGVPYVGAGVLGSAVGMDKAIMKSLFREAGLPTPQTITLLRHRWEADPGLHRARVAGELGYPCFVKPANLGSSVGVAKVKRAPDLDAAVNQAFLYDRKVLCEWAVPQARELEVSVIGNEQPEVSVVGEIVPGREFYDYRAKYIEDGSRAIIPAELDPAKAEEVRRLAARAFLALDLAGLARVDFLMDGQTGEVYLNEVNTMPGFTPISMFPKLWEASGLPFPKLLDRLIELGLARAFDRARNRIEPEPERL